MYKISEIFVTLFYIGYSKITPGTVGSFASFIILYISSIFLNKPYFFIFFLISFSLSLYFIKIYQNETSNDPPEIVIDEFLGVYVIILFIDIFHNINISLLLLFSFILFRFFDIIKPFPIGWIDKNLKNSFGVILDDILAGVYTVIILKLINEFI